MTVRRVEDGAGYLKYALGPSSPPGVVASSADWKPWLYSAETTVKSYFSGE